MLIIELLPAYLKMFAHRYLESRSKAQRLVLTPTSSGKNWSHPSLLEVKLSATVLPRGGVHPAKTPARLTDMSLTIGQITEPASLIRK